MSLLPLPTARAGAQVLVVDAANSPLVVSDAGVLDRVSVEAGGTLVADAPLTVTGDLEVKSGGRITMSPGVYVLKLDVAGTLSLALGGSIDLFARGLASANTIDPVSSEIVQQGRTGVGASHCGRGGTSGRKSLRRPTMTLRTLASPAQVARRATARPRRPADAASADAPRPATRVSSTSPERPLRERHSQRPKATQRV